MLEPLLGRIRIVGYAYTLQLQKVTVHPKCMGECNTPEGCLVFGVSIKVWGSKRSPNGV